MQHIPAHGGYQYINPPTDSRGTVFKFVDSCLHLAIWNATTSAAFAYYLGIATSAGADTITPTPDNTPSHSYAVFGQFRNVQAFFDQEVCTSGTSASSSTLTSNNLSVVTPNSMIYAAAVTGTAPTFGAVSPLAADAANTSDWGVYGEYGIETTAGNFTPQVTVTGNTDGHWNMGAISLRPATTGTASSGVRHKAIQN
jgi:hypothetical protein